MNEQIWVDIVGYEGHYQISNDGQVKSLKGGKERILSPTYNQAGYLKVCLCKNGTKKNHKIHRLVALAFVPGYQEGYVVNHIDENKTNNHVSNLEWISIRDNNNHGARTQMAVQTRQSNKGKSIYCPELDMTFTTQAEAARHFGCGRRYISKVLTGMYNTVKGYTLTYI